MKLLSVILFNCFYIAIAGYQAVKAMSLEFFVYIAVVLILFAVISLLHYVYRLPYALLWLYSFWGLFHMAGGLCRIPMDWPHATDPNVLYNLWLIPEYFKFDQFVHAFGFGITTWMVWDVLRKSLARTLDVPLGRILPTGGKVFLCALASLGFGAINEIVEFINVLILPETNVGGYINTGWDLVFNALGAGVVAILLFCKKDSFKKN